MYTVKYNATIVLFFLKAMLKEYFVRLSPEQSRKDRKDRIRITLKPENMSPLKFNPFQTNCMVHWTVRFLSSTQSPESDANCAVPEGTGLGIRQEVCDFKTKKYCLICITNIISVILVLPYLDSCLIIFGHIFFFEAKLISFITA